MTQIIALSGKKQSGKSTAVNFLYGLQMSSCDIIESFKIDEKGGLIAPFKQTDGSFEWSPFNINRKDKGGVRWLEDVVHPAIKHYSLADPLKKFCMEVFGIEPEKLYGTDEEKNTPTDIMWEDCIGITIDKRRRSNPLLIYHEEGPMTGREVMQYFGTEVVRSFKHNAWTEACLRRIFTDKPAIAVIDDVRFEDEVMLLKEFGAIVIRLTKTNKEEDQHASETHLDPENFDWDNFDHVIDNQNMDIGQKNVAIYDFLISREVFSSPFTEKEVAV